MPPLLMESLVTINTRHFIADGLLCQHNITLLLLNLVIKCNIYITFLLGAIVIIGPLVSIFCQNIH
jgi:hypothetical protein